MSYLTNENRDGPIRRGAQAILVCALAAILLQPAPASAADGDGQVRIAVTPADLADGEALAGVRGQIADAARTLCPSAGVAALYRRATHCCRRQLVADAERQLQRHAATRPTMRAGR
jgi:UrcA family protein